MNKKLNRFQAACQNSDQINKNDDVSVGSADTVFAFWEDVKSSSEDSSNSGDHSDLNLEEEEEEEEQNSSTVQVNKAFWEEQDQLLQIALYRTTTIEKKIREATKEATRELNGSSGIQMQCVCWRPASARSCRRCLQREICNRLLSLGYDCAICESKWKSSSQIPSGKHTYLEVSDKSSNKKEVKVVIELNFRGEFEMACASENYNRLINRLPEVYVGKTERLRVLVKILCSAAKKCMKEKNMHLAPWRKQKYMEAKWFNGTSTRSATAMPVVAEGYDVRPSTKPRASLLTCDLLDNIPGLHHAVVQVL